MPPATKDEIKNWIKADLKPQAAYERFREAGGKQRKQDFLAAYREVSQKPKAAYNIGGAARKDVKQPKIEKYVKKREKKKAKAAKPATAKPARTRTPKRKAKEAKRKAKKGGGGGGGGAGKSYVITKGLDIAANYRAGAPDLKQLQRTLKDHGLRFFDRKGQQTLTLAKDGENGTVNLYGKAIYEPKKDLGGRATGIARVLIDKTMKEINRK